MIQNKMISTIKEIHNIDVCLFKVGGFYHAFGRDADIISYLFDCKIKDVDGINKCTCFLYKNIILYYCSYSCYLLLFMYSK